MVRLWIINLRKFIQAWNVSYHLHFFIFFFKYIYKTSFQQYKYFTLRLISLVVFWLFMQMLCLDENSWIFSDMLIKNLNQFPFLVRCVIYLNRLSTLRCLGKWNETWNVYRKENIMNKIWKKRILDCWLYE